MRVERFNVTTNDDEHANGPDADDTSHNLPRRMDLELSDGRRVVLRLPAPPPPDIA
ncbi:MAG TPA: hypothetical protein VHD87_15155 [Acidimicrobiales bacterium]|nr:hypothetical protein [Acidimicrobiales bacterium]